MKGKIALLLFVFIILFSANIYAKENIELKVDKDSVNFGEEVTVSINVDKESKNSYAYTAKLSYDENVFEKIDIDNFEEQENWADIRYNISNKKFALINKSGESGKNLVQIKLKVKQSAKQGKTTISLGNISLSNGENDIVIDGNSVQIQVGSNEDNSIAGKTQEVSNGKLTHETASHSYKNVAIIPIALFIVVTLYLAYIYVKRDKIDKNKRIKITIVIICALLVLLLIIINILKTVKPDTNNDGKVDYDDINSIVNYLLEVENSEKLNPEQLDVNLDGEISTSDIGSVVKNVKEKTKYKAKVETTQNSEGSNQENNNSGNDNEEYITSNIENDGNKINYTPKKGEEIELELKIEVTPKIEIKAIVIGKNTYAVQKREGDKYIVKIPAPEKAGKQDIVISGIILENGRKVKTNYKITLDILKDIPKVSEINIGGEDSVPVISFDISDEDGALKSGKLIIVDDTGKIVYKSETIKKGKNKFKLENLIKNKKYRINLNIVYDLDSDIFGKPENYRYSITSEDKSFIFDEKFEDKKLNVHEIMPITTAKGITKYINKEEKFRITFEAEPQTGNGKINYPKYIRIANDKKSKEERTFELQNDKNVYTTIEEIEGYSDKGKKEIIIECVILDDGTEVVLNRSVKFEILKDKPTIENYVVKDLQYPTIIFDINDNDGAFKSGQLIINEYNAQKTIKAGHNEIAIDNIEGTKFTITISCLYNLDEEDNQNSGMATLKTDTIKVIDNYDFKFGNIKVYSVNKEEKKVTLSFDTFNSANLKLSEVWINDEKYEPIYNEEIKKYTIEIPYSDQNKIVTIKKVVLENGKTFINEENTTEYKGDYSEELKQNGSIELYIEAPFIKEKNIKADIIEGNKVKANFYIENSDTITKLHALLIDKDNITLETITLDNTASEVIFDRTIQTLNEYTIKIIASYDLNCGDSKTDVEIGSTTVKINLKASINNISATQYIEKQQEIEILFNVSANVELDLAKVKIKDKDDNDVEIISLEKQENNNLQAQNTESQNEQKYKAKIKAGNKCGKVDYRITEVTYQEEKVDITENNTFSVTVLKDVPTITEYRFDDTSESVKISFNVNDEEEALTEGNATVKNGESVIKSETIKNGKTAITLDKSAINGNNCILSITGKYDLGNGEVKNLEFKDKEIKIIENYSFNFELNSGILNDKKIKIAFTSNNSTEYKPEKITIEGINGEINVESDKDISRKNSKVGDLNSSNYVSEIPYESTDNKIFTINSVILDNGKEFEITDKNKFEVFIEKPSISDLKLDENGKVTFNLKDTKATLSEIKVVLLGINGEQIEEKTIDKTQGNKEVEFNKKLETAGQYKAKILATYNCNDGEIHEGENISECDKFIEIVSKITNITPDTVIQEKGSELNVSVTVEDNTDLKINKFIFVDVNNEENKVEHTVISNTGDTYSLQAILGNKAGNTQYKVEEVEYENILQSTKVSESKIVDIDILKDTPKIQFIYDESGDKPTLTANVNDKDNAIIEGNLAVLKTEKITETGDKNSNALKSMKIEKDVEYYDFNLHELKLEEEISHTAIAFGQYDLDSNNNNNQNSHILSEALQFLHITSYNIQINNVDVESVDNVNKKVTISFVSTNVTSDNEGSLPRYDVKQVEINGKIYEVTASEGNKYTVEIPYNLDETKEFNITKIILSNNKSETFEKGQYQAKIFKTAPTIENLSVDINDEGIVNATYKLKDEESTVTALYATLKDPSNEIIVEKKKIDNIEQGKISFDDNAVNDCGKYTVEISADYNLNDGNTYEGQVLSTSYAEIELNADITSAKCDKEYIEKGKDIEITYKVEDNIDADDRDEYAVKGIEIAKKDGENYIDEQIYQVKEQEEKNTYVVTIPAPNEAGKITFVPKRIIYINNATSIEYSSSTDLDNNNIETEIEVLKTKPEIVNYSLNDNDVTFDLKDDDNTLVSGTITLSNKNSIDTDTITKELSNHNTISIKDVKNDTYTLKVEATYNLDQEKTDKNKHDKEIIYQNEIQIINDYQLHFDNLKVERFDKENKKVYVTFESTNAIQNPVATVKINETVYQIKKLEGNKYEVEVSYETEDTKTEYEFKELTLENGKTLNIESKNKRVEIFKQDPIIEQLKASAENQNLKVDFNLLDDDNTISKLYITVKDANSELQKVEVNKATNISKTIENILTKAGTYTIGIYADLDKVNGEEMQENVLLQSIDYKEEIKVQITSCKFTKNNENIIYAEKQTNVDLIFEITDNTDLPILEMVINGTNYTPEVQEDGKYKVHITTPDSAGNAKYIVSQIRYDQLTIETNYTSTLEILKTKPRVDTYLFNDDKKISFNLIDVDNTFVNGKVVITNNNQTIKEYIINGSGEQTIDLEQSIGNNTYKLQIIVTYNLYQNNTENKNTTESIYDTELKIINNYNLSIENLKINEINTDAKTVSIEFDADNGSDETDSRISNLFIDGYDNAVDVKYEKRKYSAIISYQGDNYQKQKLIFTKVYLKNGKELDIEDKYIEIFKEKPEVTDLSGELEDRTITFNITDTDNTLSKIQARLKTVKTIEQDYATLTEETLYMQKALTAQELKQKIKEDGTVKLTLDKIEDVVLDTKLAENYTIEILADYENYDGDSHIDESIGNSSINVPINAEIEKCTIDKQYVEKGETITPKIEITDNTSMDVTSVEINGTQCYVEKQEEDAYIAKYNAPDKTGEIKLDITKINYENESVNTNFESESKIEVLKSIPTLENYNPKTTVDNPYVSFSIKDEDNALSNAHITITKLDDKNTKVIEQEVQSGENNIDLKQLDDGIYYINIGGNYNRHINNAQTENITFTEESQKIQILKGYDIQIVDLITSEFSLMDMPLMISFYASNAKGLEVDSIKINNASYPVQNYGIISESNSELTYFITVVMGWKHKIGYNEVVVDSITLSNNQEIIVERNLSYVLEKTRPEATNLKLEENDQASELTATFNLTDPDKTIRKLNAVLKDANGNVAKTVEVNLDEPEIEPQEPEEQPEEENSGTKKEEIDKTKKTITFTETPITSKYIVELQAIYDLVGHKDDYVQEKSLIRTSIDAKTRAVIRNIKPSNEYPQKGENVKFNYIIENNLPEHTYITGLVINGETQVLNNTNGNNYELNIKMPNDDGKMDYVVSDILYTTGSYKLDEEYQKHTNIDVLKDRPQITNYRVIDNFAKKTAEFKFDIEDEDNALSEGYVTIEGKATRQDIHKGQNTVKFNDIETNQSMNLQIISKYDLDSEKNNNKNEHEETNKKPFKLISDYNLNITNMVTSGYYEKNKSVDLEFKSTNVLDSEGVYPTTIIVNGKEYNLEKSDEYYLTDLDGYSQAGKKNIKIDEIILNSGKVLKGKETDTTDVEVLKDKVSVSKFAYDTEDKEKISLEFNLKDIDESLIDNAKIKIIDDNKLINKTVKEDTINASETKKIEFDKTGSQKYKIIINANGSRDIDKNQKWQYNEEIFNREISLTDRYIEMKEIKEVLLYKVKDNQITYLSEISEDEIKNHLQDYILKIEMENMPAFYTDIKGYKIENNILYFTVDYEHSIQYSADSSKTEIEVEYGVLSGNKYINNNLETLLKAIKDNPSGTFEISKDYDFDTVGNKKSIIDENIVFKGTIIGHGHKFINMSNPLFDKMENATIKDLVIEKAHVISEARGILATTMNGGTIENVHITNSTITKSTYDGVGALIGNIASGNTTISKCSVTNTTVKGSKRLGGIIGYVNSGSSKTNMENCYENATIISDYDAVGGLIGEANGTLTISNCYSAGTITQDGNSGGIIGWRGGNLTSKNNISLADGAKNKFYANGVNTSENNYELKEASGNPSTEQGIKVIEKSAINEELFSNTLKWDSTVWNYENASYENLPVLRNDDPNNNSQAKTPNNKDVYIPEYERISEIEDYDGDKEILYNNLYKLMPFYDAKYLVEDAKKIDKTSTLNTKLIKGILPYNANGDIISSLTTENYQTISKIKIIYTDDTAEDYDTIFETYFGNIATYELPRLSNIKYSYNHYVLDSNNSIINELTDYILGLDFVMDLDRITEGDDSRLYRENYTSKFSITKEATNEQKQKIRDNIRQFVLNVLSTNNYAITSNNNNIVSSIKNELINNGTLKKMLYSYNYYDRWYNINIEGMKIVDMLAFHGDIFNKKLNLKTLSTELLKDGTKNIDTRLVNSFYMNYISKYTGYSKVGEFLDFFIKLSGKYEDVNDWLPKNFNGPIAEAPLEGHPEVNWRAWYMLKNHENGKFLLYILTMPERSTYILSHPTMVTVGSTRTYIKDPFVEKDYQALEEKVKNYTKNLGIWYTNTWPLIQDEKIYNNLIHFGTDTRYTINSNGANVRQNAGTEEPFHKNFNEAAGHWSGSAGGAYAYGNGVCWTAYKCLNTYYAYTHENSHNQDVKLFMKNRGGRRGGVEEYTDSLFVQQFGDGQIQMNLNYEYANGSHIASNYTPERINSLDKIHDFYKKLFDASDFIDYAAAKAFIQLTPEQQSYVAIQIDSSQNFGQYAYRIRTPAEFENMHIKNIEDLWDNQIMVYVGLMCKNNGYIFMEEANHSNIAQTIYDARWYQPYSETGIGKSCSFKYTAYEMLGQAGYDDGLITWLSNKNGTIKSDTQALREVMKDPNLTWKQYKTNRYAEMEKQWNSINYIDADELVKKFKEAFEKDAETEKEIGYEKYSRNRNLSNYKKVVSDAFYTLKGNTDDFRGQIFSEKDEEQKEIHVKNAEEFAKQASNHIKATIVLDNDIDFSGYDSKSNIVTAAFMGKLKGNGYTLKGNKVPLFNQLIDAEIDNVNIENTNIELNISEIGALTRKATKTTINNTKINNITITSNSDSIGGLIGNTEECTIQNTVAKNVTIKGNKNVGGLIGNSSNSKITSSYINTANIEGTTKAGGLIGNLINESNVEKSSSNTSTIRTTQDSAGGLVGEIYNSTIKNSYASQADIQARSYAGGLVGYAESPNITNCYAHAVVKANSNGAGFIGVTKNNSIIQYNVSFSNVESTISKFDSATQSNILKNENYSNNYEITEYTGKTALSRGIDINTINSVSYANFYETNGYINKLNWTEDVWNFEQTTNGKLPLLKGGDDKQVELLTTQTQSAPILVDPEKTKKLQQMNVENEVQDPTNNQLENTEVDNSLKFNTSNNNINDEDLSKTNNNIVSSSIQNNTSTQENTDIQKNEILESNKNTQNGVYVEDDINKNENIDLKNN